MMGAGDMTNAEVITRIIRAIEMEITLVDMTGLSFGILLLDSYQL